MNSHQLLRQEIEQKPALPVISPRISYLLKVLNNDDIGYAQLAEELEKFPSIAIKIVTTANSAWAAPVTPITNLRDSCARVGVQVVRSISIALSISQIFDPARCVAFDVKKHWVSALLTAEAAQICAKDKRDVCSDTARLAGLLHNIGLLWLASQKPQQTARAITQDQSSETCTLSDALTEQLGMNLFTAGGYLASYMELPDAIVDVIASPGTDQADSNALIDNHKQARQLVSKILMPTDTSSDNLIASEECPQHELLSSKLNSIQSLVQELFF